MKQIFIILLLMTFTFGCSARDKTEIIQLENAGGIPVIKVNVKGKETFMVLDTGGSLSVIDENLSKKLNFETFDVYDMNSITGYGGIITPKSTNITSIMIGTHKLNGNFVSQDLSALTSAIYNNTGIRVSGIMGINFIRTYKFSFDFESNKITFKY